MPFWPALSSVSSQVSQVPHGVLPPAQLVAVPAMPTHSATLSRRTSTTVQPPAAAGSYTKPSVWREREVPPILLSGNHGAIAQWRREQQLERTRTRRPDLLAD